MHNKLLMLLVYSDNCVSSLIYHFQKLQNFAHFFAEQKFIKQLRSCNPTVAFVSASPVPAALPWHLVKLRVESDCYRFPLS